MITALGGAVPVPSAVPPTADSGDDHPDMHPLFQSAEDFIELWERCQAFADRGGQTRAGELP